MKTGTGYWRVAFIVFGILALSAGLYLFVFAESVATLPAALRGGNPWPWLIGPLAMRFVASLAIAAAVGCLLVAWRPDTATVSAFLQIAVIISGCLLVHAASNWGGIDWSRPLGMAWLAGFVLLFLTAGAFTLMRRHSLTVLALPTTPRVAKGIMVFIFFLTGLVGGVLFFLPELGRERWPWDLANSVNVQLLGALFLGVAISALWAWRQPTWYGYDALFAAAGSFAAAALVASFMHWSLFASHPITSWLFVFTYVLGTVFGFYPFFRYVVWHENRLVATNSATA
jgi:hypothetical protein